MRADTSQLLASPEGAAYAFAGRSTGMRKLLDVLAFTLVERAVGLHMERSAIGDTQTMRELLALLVDATLRAKPGAR